MTVKLYVAAVAVLAAVCGWAAAVLEPAQRHLPMPALMLLGAVILMAECLQVRYYLRGNHIDSHNLVPATLAPLVFLASGAEAVIVCAIAITVAQGVRRNSFTKGLFNVAQWTLTIAIEVIVFSALQANVSESGQAIGLLVVAMLCGTLANQLTMGGVLILANGHRHQRRGVESRVPAITHAIAVVSDMVVGVALAAAAMVTPWTIVAGAVFVLAAFFAGRANVIVNADRRRLEGLQRATHALVTSLDVDEALPVFLREARAGFEVRTVQLVLLYGEGTEIYTTGEPVGGHCTVEQGRHELAELLLPVAAEPTRFTIDSGDVYVRAALERSGHERCLAAPLRSGGRTFGMLLLYDRFGMEGFEDGELSIASALSRELVGFMERVELLATVDAERLKLTEILESTSDGIVTIDADGVITSWNAGLAAITGYPASEMIGTRHFGLLRPRDAAGRDVLIERWRDMFETAGGPPPELQTFSASGHSIWLSCSYSRIAASEERADTLVVVARNITQARELERLKDDFVAVVSHELRTPLVPIKGWAQTLINRGDRLSDDQRRTAVQSILSQAQKLEALVLNILEASRIESGRSDGEGVADVAAVTMRIVEDNLAARPDRIVRVGPPAVPCQVRGSAVWVERAVSNLVANAVKYSPDEEPVDVAVFAEGDDIVVTVTDRGPGIAADAQERIFERFERLEETMKQTGTGLGLYITRRLARAMGGDVTVSSVPGAGSTFSLRLPAAPVQPAKLPEQRPGEAPQIITGEHDATVLHLR
jgi:PAS domain S-box-containing protein